MQDALYTTEHSLIDQRLHSRMGAETTNGDGFGVGWYDAEPLPGASRSIEPAWNDHNLRELARHVTSHLFFAHIRAAIGSAVQQTNCHPFRYGRWLFMQNGFVSDLDALKRELVFAIDPSLYPEIKGQTDTEMLFYLALTLGLEDDPPRAVARAIGLVETIAQQRGVEHPFQGTIATSDGEGLWAFRYSSKGTSGSLFFSRDVRTLRALYPNRQVLQDLAENARIIVSEPVGSLRGAWTEVPEASCGIIGRGEDRVVAFEPTPASAPGTTF